MKSALEAALDALRSLHSAVDQEVMGDTDPPEDDSLLMNAMQQAASVIRASSPLAGVLQAAMKESSEPTQDDTALLNWLDMYCGWSQTTGTTRVTMWMDLTLPRAGATLRESLRANMKRRAT